MAQAKRAEAGHGESTRSTTSRSAWRASAWLRWLLAGLLVVKAGALVLGAHGALAAADRAPGATNPSGALDPSAAAKSSGLGGSATDAVEASAAKRGTAAGQREGATTRQEVASVANPTAVRRSEGPQRGAGQANVPALLDAIVRRQAELDERERDAGKREEQLRAYEREVTGKIQRLEEIEKRLQATAGETAAASEKAAASLAKVYGTMRPADAAPILEQLDEAIVLSILARMKEKEVGQILPLMARERAVVLTRSLVSRR